MEILIILLSLCGGEPAYTCSMLDGPAAFHEYCGRCHALPDVRGVDEVPEVMFQYARLFGASELEVEAIRQYVRNIRNEGDE